MHFYPLLCLSLLFPVLSQNSLSLCLVLSLSAEGPWIYQAKLRNTDSDRGNVDRVTSHALACPNTQSSANHRLRIYLFNFNSALCPLLTLFAGAKVWIGRIHKNIKRQETHSIFPKLFICSEAAFSCKNSPPKINHKVFLPISMP